MTRINHTLNLTIIFRHYSPNLYKEAVYRSFARAIFY